MKTKLSYISDNAPRLNFCQVGIWYPRKKLMLLSRNSLAIIPELDFTCVRPKKPWESIRETTTLRAKHALKGKQI